MGDLNVELSETGMSNFLDIYKLNNLVKQPTYFFEKS